MAHQLFPVGTIRTFPLEMFCITTICYTSITNVCCVSNIVVVALLLYVIVTLLMYALIALLARRAGGARRAGRRIYIDI